MSRPLPALPLALALLAGCGPGVDRASTLASLREAMNQELEAGDTEAVEEHNRLVETARDGDIFLDMRRFEVQEALGRGQECGTRDLCARGGFEADDWVYEIGRRDGVPWGPTLIIGFDRQGVVTNVYSLTRR